MDTQRIINIRSLVQSSLILSPEEKTEWSVLLDLMNERQLQELQRILEEGKRMEQGNGKKAESQNQNPVKPYVPGLLPKPPVLNGTPKAHPANVPVSITLHVEPQVKPAALPSLDKVDSDQRKKSDNLSAPIKQSLPPAKTLPQVPSKPLMPKLSHIVNLPRVVPPTPGYVKDSPVGKSTGVVKGLAEKATPSFFGTKGFAAKIKEILNEKELPSPDIKAEPVKKPVIQDHPGVSVEATVKIDIPQVAIPSKSDKPVVPVQTVEKSLPKPGLAAPEPGVPLPTGGSGVSVRPVVNAGVHSSGNYNLNKPSQELLKSIKQHSGVESDSQALPGRPPLSLAGLAVSSVKDLEVLEANNIADFDLDDAVKKIKLLIAKDGFFTVLFSIEKSPLYRSYIATGSKLLSQEGGFEEIEGVTGNELLNKQQFEKFTDLLARIQAS